jgi:hypothetical protein
MLESPVPAVDIENTGNGMLLALDNGRSFYLEGSPQQLIRGVELQMDPKPVGRVTQVFGFPVPFVLTDKGELYYQECIENGMLQMKQIQTNVRIKQWSPLNFVYYDGNSTLIGKALDLESHVHEIFMVLDKSIDPYFPVTNLEVKKTVDTAVSLVGGAVIQSDGRILEKYNNKQFESRIPSGSELLSTVSLYLSPGEGRSSWYHVYVTKDGTIYWQGDLLYTGPSVIPDFVRLPE